MRPCDLEQLIRIIEKAREALSGFGVDADSLQWWVEFLRGLLGSG